jgi:hypothetical protein
VILEIGIAIGIEIETFRQKSDFDFDFARTRVCCAAKIRLICKYLAPSGLLG